MFLAVEIINIYKGTVCLFVSLLSLKSNFMKKQKLTKSQKESKGMCFFLRVIKKWQMWVVLFKTPSPVLVEIRVKG